MIEFVIDDSAHCFTSFAFGNVDLGGHARHKLFAGIGNEQLELNGLDVALHAVHVALRGEIAFRRFGDDFALEGVAAGHDDAQ